MRQTLTKAFIIMLCIIILLPNFIVYADLAYETKEVIIYNSLEKANERDVLLLNNKNVYMKLDSILKYTGYQCDYEVEDTFFRLRRNGKTVFIDKDKGELQYGKTIVKIQDVISYEKDIWIPVDPVLLYLNTRCEVVDNKVVILASEITLNEYMSMFYEMLESQLCTIQWAENEEKWGYDILVGVTSVLDVIFNDKMSSFVTLQYNKDRCRSILLSVMDSIDEELYDIGWAKYYADAIENTKWYKEMDKYSKVELDEVIAVVKIADYVGDVLEVADYIEAVYTIQEFNMDLVKNVVIDGNQYFGKSFSKSKMYEAANEILELYRKERTPVKEFTNLLGKQGFGNITDWASSKVLNLEGGNAIAMIGLKAFGKLQGWDKNFDDFLVLKDMYLFQKEIENGFFTAAKEAIRNPETIDTKKIDFIYDSGLLYIQIRNAADKILGINANKVYETYKEFLSVDKKMLYFDDPGHLPDLCITYDDIVNLDNKEAESDIIWLDTNFDYILHFSEGLSPVELNGKYGYIDKAGKEVIPLMYEYAWDFIEGLAAVRIDGKCGYINKIGKIVIPPKYDFASEFREGLALVYLNGKYGYIDKRGTEVIPLEYGGASPFIEGLAYVSIDTYPNSKYGYIDKTGREVIPFKYDFAWPFSDGLAPVCLDGKWGYIDKTGREVIPLRYDSAWSFVEGLARVDLNGKWGYIDRTGKEITPIIYEDVDDYAEDYILSINEGFALVELDGKYGYIDKTGKEVIPIKYDYAESFNEGLASVSIGTYPNNKYGYIDKRGREVIPFKYDIAWSFREGLALVKLDGKYGYIDKTGKEVVPLIYDDGTYFIDGVAIVKLNNKWGILRNPLR